MLKQILREIFYVLSFLILSLSMLEVIKPRIVLAYFDLNLLLIFWLILGIFIVLSSNKSYAKNGKK